LLEKGGDIRGAVNRILYSYKTVNGNDTRNFDSAILPKTAVKPRAYPNGAETGRGYQAREMTNAIEPYKAERLGFEIV
jgi:hypothetical protein